MYRTVSISASLKHDSLETNALHCGTDFFKANCYTERCRPYIGGSCTLVWTLISWTSSGRMLGERRVVARLLAFMPTSTSLSFQRTKYSTGTVAPSVLRTRELTTFILRLLNYSCAEILRASRNSRSVRSMQVGICVCRCHARTMYCTRIHRFHTMLEERSWLQTTDCSIVLWKEKVKFQTEYIPPDTRRTCTSLACLIP
jgi:hypothetical protein